MTNEQGQEEFFVFAVIPFGFNDATSIMARLLRPLRVFLHGLSVDVSWFVDDGGSVGVSLRRCASYQKITFFMLALCGWELAAEKTCLPATCVLYLGFYINSMEMQIWAPVRKIAKLQRDIDHIIAANRFQVKIPNKQTAGALGTVCHLLQSHGDILRVVSRESQHRLGSAVILEGWDADMFITDRMVEELQLCKVYLEEFNGRPIRYEPKETHILKPVHKKYLLENWDPRNDERDLITMVSDASDTRAYVYKADDFQIVTEFPFSMDEATSSSTLRELSAIHKLFLSDKGFLYDNQHKLILWLTDSMNLCHIMRRGSRIRSLQRMVLDIFELMNKWGKINIRVSKIFSYFQVFLITVCFLLDLLYILIGIHI